MNAMPPKLRPHRPIREKYCAKPNAMERKHKANVLEKPCFGCGAWGVQAHHTLLKFPAKRFRRDHRCLLPVCPECHRQIHDAFGDEAEWLASMDRTEGAAVAYIIDLWAETIGL